MAVFKPGRDPLESLAVALAGLDGSKPSATAIQSLMSTLRAEENTLHLTTRLALRDAPAMRRVVLLIDQFEEVFTLCDDVATRNALFANLVYAATITGGRTVVVLTMRADFYGKCGPYPALAAAMSEHQLLVGPMTEDELRLAIDRPAQLAGGEFEPGLSLRERVSFLFHRPRRKSKETHFRGANRDFFQTTSLTPRFTLIDLLE